MPLKCPKCCAAMAEVDGVPVLQSLARCCVFQCEACLHVHVPDPIAPDWWFMHRLAMDRNDEEPVVRTRHPPVVVQLVPQGRYDAASAERPGRAAAPPSEALRRRGTEAVTINIRLR